MVFIYWCHDDGRFSKITVLLPSGLMGNSLRLSLASGLLHKYIQLLALGVSLLLALLLCHFVLRK